MSFLEKFVESVQKKGVDIRPKDSEKGIGSDITADELEVVGGGAKIKAGTGPVSWSLPFPPPPGPINPWPRQIGEPPPSTPAPPHPEIPAN